MFTPEVKYVFEYQGMSAALEMGYFPPTGQRVVTSRESFINYPLGYSTPYIQTYDNVIFMDFLKTGNPFQEIQAQFISSFEEKYFEDGTLRTANLIYKLPDVNKYFIAVYDVMQDFAEINGEPSTVNIPMFGPTGSQIPSAF